jgi:FkbM family methyltransferase
MDRHTVEKRIRGLRYGMLVGRTESMRLPKSLLIARHRRPVSFPDEVGVRTAFAEILLSDVYDLERRGRNAFSSVLDIGANVGLFTIAARNVHRSAQIHAYEPNVGLASHLETQVRAADAVWFREAVGGTVGHGSLEIDPTESVHSRLVPDEMGSVPVVTLGTAVERLGMVDFAKIDCEGCEWSLFDDSEPWQLIDELALEYHDREGHGVEEASGRIESLGFSIRSVAPGPGYGVILAGRRG